jgi:hypothetical protein
MRHPIAAVLIVVSTVVAGAQSSSQHVSASAGAPIGPRATVGGCLAAGPTATTFTLTTAEADLKAIGPIGVAGSPEAGASKPDVKTVVYTLTPQPGVDLAAHIGHTVEVSGTEPPGNETASTPEKSRNTTPVTGMAGEHPAPTVQTTARPEIVARRMNVSAVKMVANDCRIHK